MTTDAQKADFEKVDATLTAEFPPGTLVALKSGGPAMTVSGVQSGKVWTCHFEANRDYLGFGGDSKRLQQSSFWPAMLTKREG
jgi:uncharacterized protein YodC (DUF2158 family)